MGTNKKNKRFAGTARKNIDCKWKKHAFKTSRPNKIGKCKATTKKARNFSKQKHTARNLMMKELKEKMVTMITETTTATTER